MFRSVRCTGVGIFFALIFFIGGVSNVSGQVKTDAKGKVSVCKEVDDDWKCVGESDKWAANTNFNVLFVNPVPLKVSFIGIVFYEQDTTGKDVLFINEYQQQFGDGNRKYATVGDNFKLPAGVYSIYIISWDKRENLMKNGNFVDYFAKTTLTVK